MKGWFVCAVAFAVMSDVISWGYLAGHISEIFLF